MEIREKEVDFKISRLKDAGNFELALQAMEKSEEEIKKAAKNKDKLSSVIGMMLGLFRQFFIQATGVDVLEDCDDLEEAKEAYYEFLEEIKLQKDKIINFSAADIK